MQLIEHETSFHDDANGLVISKAQEISDDFLARMRAIKADSTDQREGDFMLACSVPTIIHEAWLKEGYDMTREPARNTIKRLREKGLDAFIATNKRV